MKKISILIAVLLVIVWAGKDKLFGWALSAAASGAIGVPVSVGSTQLDPLSGKIAVRDLRVKNPAGFKGSAMLNAPLLAIDCEPRSLLSGKPHFEQIRIELSELTVIRNKEGKYNLNAVKFKQSGSSAQKKPAQRFLIDRLYLTIGKVVFEDYGAGDKPSVQTFSVGLKDKEFKNITSTEAVISLLLFEALTRTTLTKVADLDIQSLRSAAQDALKQGLGMTKEGVDQLENVAKGLANLLN